MVTLLTAIRALDLLLALITASLGIYCLAKLFTPGLRDYKFIVTTKTLVKLLTTFTTGIVLYGIGFIVSHVLKADPVIAALLYTGILVFCVVGMYYFVMLLRVPVAL